MAKKRQYQGYHIEDNQESVRLLHRYIDIEMDRLMPRKKALDCIKEVANSLSATGNQYPVYINSYQKGEDILADESLKTLHPQIEHPHLQYTLTKQVWRVVNHKNRLKTIWKQRNKELLKEYVTEVIGLYDDSQNGFDFTDELTDQYIKVEVLKTVATMQIEAAQRKQRKRKNRKTPIKVTR